MITKFQVSGHYFDRKVVKYSLIINVDLEFYHSFDECQPLSSAQSILRKNRLFILWMKLLQRLILINIRYKRHPELFLLGKLFSIFSINRAYLVIQQAIQVEFTQ